MNYTPRVRVKLVMETGHYQVQHPQEPLNRPRKLESADREHFLVVHLSTKNTVNGVETVSVGTLNKTLIHPREIFKGAILNNAARVVLVHNHPSGDPEPSLEDINLTRKLVDAGNILSIPVVDHIMVGHGRFVSFKERGILF